MKSFLSSLLLLLATAALPIFAAQLPSTCYPTDSGTDFCIQAAVGKVQVLLYNAGWCPACNDEVDSIVAAFPEFDGKNVVFVSLSGNGYNSGSQPNLSYFKQWRSQHHIPAGIVVGGKYRDYGEAFGTTGYIPYAVIIDAQGNVVKNDNLDPSEIISTVRDLLK